jgi:hypothetical protein
VHDEDDLQPSRPAIFGAAVVIGDKADVARERVRNPHMAAFDIHDRINYAARETRLEASIRRPQTISLEL